MRLKMAGLLGEVLPSEGASFRRLAQGGHAGLIRLQAIEQPQSMRKSQGGFLDACAKYPEKYVIIVQSRDPADPNEA
jgi:hypothetical protein